MHRLGSPTVSSKSDTFSKGRERSILFLYSKGIASKGLITIWLRQTKRSKRGPKRHPRFYVFLYKLQGEQRNTEGELYIHRTEYGEPATKKRRSIVQRAARLPIVQNANGLYMI